MTRVYVYFNVLLVWGVKMLRDNRGASIDTILVVAAVSIPLVVVLIAFSENIVEFLENRVNDLNS